MAEESAKVPVTDSRVAGFDPEVEASHAEAAAAEAAAAAAAKAADPTSPPPPTHTHRCGMCGAMYESLLHLCAACGASDSVTAIAKGEE